MTPEQWQQAKEILNQALSHAPDEQATFLSNACADDVDLHREVESLLAAYHHADQFIETPAVEDVFKLVESNKPDATTGRRVGQYEIIQKLGDGGMGTVYLARRADDQYQKQVAIKLVKFGFDNEFVVNRFLSERQILASLDHPNIARLLDGGTSEAGSPYLVMEYIDGLPVDEYCEQHQLTIAQRLKLFRTVCAAVQYAHSNLVIHRDIKPSNILVTADGIPKLLDFGIAKLLEPEPAAPGYAVTVTGIKLMTPDYASPEQVLGANVTTATDIYSLGVVLYELLTGQRPHRLKSHSAEELFRAICEAETERPSAVVRSGDTGADPGRQAPFKGEPQKLARQLQGDLDNIVLMALRKESERRYESAAQFSADIQRHLDGLPVIARKDTFKYRAGKFVRRNRAGVAAAVIVMLSLLAGVVATVWQARTAARQARIAQQEKAKAESISAVLEQMLNHPLTSSGKHPHETTLTEALDEAAKRLDSSEFANQPEIKAELERIVGISYDYAGRYDLAAKHLQTYVELQRNLGSETDPKTLDATATWATVLVFKDDMAGAEVVYRRVLPLMRSQERTGSLKPEMLASALTAFAYLRRTQGDSREAESLFRETLALGPRIPVEFRYLQRLTRSTLALTIADQGRFDEALQTSLDAVAEFRQKGQTDSPDYAFSLTVFGGFALEQGNFAEADSSLREAEVLFRKLLQPTHLWLGDNLRNQAISLYRQNKFAEAQEKITETLKIYRESFGVKYDNYPTALITQGLILTKTGKSNEGETILREAVKLRSAALPKEHFWVAEANGALGECLTTQKRFAEAEALLVESYNTLNSRLGKQDPRTREGLLRLVDLYEHWNKPDEVARYRGEQ